MSAFKFSHRLFFICSFLLLLNSSLFATGVLDKSFGNNGKVSVFQGVFAESKVLIQPDDKIIVAYGGFPPGVGYRQISVVRYKADGSIDNTFKSGNPRSFGEGGVLGNIKLQSDGKIVIVGRTILGGIESLNWEYYIVRLNTDGSFDQTFGTNGQVRINRNSPGSNLNDIVIQPDGKIVVAGGTGSSTGEIVRLNSDGSIDTSLGNSGFFTASSPYFQLFNSIALTANGKILVSGFKGDGPEGSDGGLIRLEQNGNLDSSFGQSGLVRILGGITTFIVQSDAKIIVNSGIGVRRLLSDGTFDASFQTTSTGAIKLLSDGRLLTLSTNGRINLLNGNGQLIGKAETPHPDNPADFLSFADVAVQSNGKIVTLIYSRRPFTPEVPPSIFTVRYNSITSLANRIVDYDADEKVDIGVYRPSNQTFYLLQSSLGFNSYTAQTPVNNLFPKDYSADFKSEFVWSSVQQSYNYFCGFNAITTPPDCYQWGLSTDVPLGGDYDGDNKSDFAIYRNGFWHIRQSSTNTSLYFNWGTTGDKPVPADYDGDGKTDAAIYRPSTGTWWVLQSSDSTYRAFQFGLSDDKPVPADYDGDGRADYAVYRPGNGVWYLYQSINGFAAAQFGISTDRPVPGDYDGDGRTDIAVFRPSEGNWYLLESTNGFAAIHWGQNGDIPLTTAYSAY